jgi:cysteine synthase A
MGAALGYDSVFTLPSSISKNKQDVMRLLGAEVRLQPLVPFSDSQHFYHVAQRLGKELPHAVCLDQFENMANSQAHYESTAPEVCLCVFVWVGVTGRKSPRGRATLLTNLCAAQIWVQANGKIDGFVCSAGTGGTLGGISSFLKEKKSSIQCYLIDPPGSGLLLRVV